MPSFRTSGSVGNLNHFNDFHAMLITFQTAESIAEHVLNLVSADANLANADPSLANLPWTDAAAVLAQAEASSSQSASANSDASIRLPQPPATPQTNKSSSAEGSQTLDATPPLPDPENLHPEPQQSNRGMTTPEELLEEKDVFECVLPAVLNKTKNDNNNSDWENSRPTSSNSMSVSVPNLTSSREQTVFLLESFAAVARRNLGNSANNMARSAHASSLVRLALASNSPGKSPYQS